MTIDPTDLARQSADAMRDVLSHLEPGHASRPTPCHEFDVAELVRHAIDTQHLFTRAAGGRATRVGDDLAAAFDAAARRHDETWQKRGADGTVDLDGNTLPAVVALQVAAVDAFVHAWDLARAIEAPFDVPSGLAEALIEVANGLLASGSDREPGGPFASPVPVAGDAPALERLIGFTGRDPAWAAA